MDKSLERDQHPPEEEKTSLTKLNSELQRVKALNTTLENRLARMELTLDTLTKNLSASVMPQSTEPSEETIDTYITEHIRERLAQEEVRKIDVEGVSSTWNYFVAQKGGYDEILYLTVQDFLKIGAESVQFLAFLLEKRDHEVKESLQHLQTEYSKLEGHQLQQHFTELWQLHHNLLKKKLIRTWKEEIFLEAFEAFLAWLQRET